MRHLFELRAILIALFTLLSSAVMAESSRLAIIEDYSGSPASITITRESKPMKLELGRDLIAGDVVSVTGEGYVVLRLYSGSRHVDSAVSPFLLVDDAGPLDNISANFARVLDVVAWWDDSGSDEPMRSRDGVPPVIAALERAPTPRILAGARTLNLAWVDGKGPFEITLRKGTTIVASASADAGIREVAVTGTFAPNQTYTLELFDMSRDAAPKASYELTTVEALPTIEVSIPDGDDLRPLLVAAELASLERGSWAFEALQQLHALPTGSRFRNALIKAIQHGDHP